ncbi:hypothetical protein MAE02_69670 [Microvirga aerophila]|uniref:Uncharacterized protein n=1 Tax=Microvirga aerophila TaxID=670291 RepID=A0A512C500_9HYPH|nr:hypothetical protein MAE02_69670 [Microvirga aerophila]
MTGKVDRAVSRGMGRPENFANDHNDGLYRQLRRSIVVSILIGAGKLLPLIEFGLRL